MDRADACCPSSPAVPASMWAFTLIFWRCSRSPYWAGAYIVSAWAGGQGLLDSIAVVLFPVITVQVGYFLGLTTRPAYLHLRSRLNIRHSERA